MSFINTITPTCDACGASEISAQIKSFHAMCALLWVCWRTWFAIWTSLTFQAFAFVEIVFQRTSFAIFILITGKIRNARRSIQLMSMNTTLTQSAIGYWARLTRSFANGNANISLNFKAFFTGKTGGLIASCTVVRARNTRELLAFDLIKFSEVVFAAQAFINSFRVARSAA